MDLLPINQGINSWIQKFQFWKNQTFDRSFKGNDNYNIRVQNKKLFEWYSLWLKKIVSKGNLGDIWKIKKSVDCVVVTYNRLDLLKECVQAIEKQTYPVSNFL